MFIDFTYPQPLKFDLTSDSRSRTDHQLRSLERFEDYAPPNIYQWKNDDLLYLVNLNILWALCGKAYFEFYMSAVCINWSMYDACTGGQSYPIPETTGLFNMVRILTVALQDLVDHPLGYIEAGDILVRTFGKIEDISHLNNSAGTGQVYKVYKILLSTKIQAHHLYVAQHSNELEQFRWWITTQARGLT